MAIQDWQTMTCTECPSIDFVPRSNLKWKKDGGLTPSHVGWQCAQCNNTIDTGRLIAQATIRQKQQELDSMKEEMRDMETVASSPAPKKAAPAKATA